MVNELYTDYYHSPLGWVEIEGTEAAITAIGFVADEAARPPVDRAGLPPVLQSCHTQLAEYFHKKRQEFSLPLAPAGTDFQQRVWRQLRAIPYGQTASYLEIACAVGNAKAVRAVGAANGSNPISIVVPCHRVIGSNGKLTGYGGGLWRKEWLLNHEGWRRHPQLTLF